MSEHPCSTCARPSRRAVLAGAGALGVAGLLSACGGGDSGAPMAQSGPDDPVIVGLDELREQGAVGFETTDGGAIAIARGDDVVAYSSRCTHEGCTVGWDADAEQISCPCHGSRFDPADGSVLNGPAREPLPAVRVEVDPAEGVLRRV
ncbi:MAG TPA: Rieske (2Fe-2S) protein [Mycobacteriales bacterium]|nr:Rieske (2Fe-2S) protein [Mycobacteriales bacterium]